VLLEVCGYSKIGRWLQLGKGTSELAWPRRCLSISIIRQALKCDDSDSRVRKLIHAGQKLGAFLE